MWTDDHCHLPEAIGEAAAVVEDAKAAGVTRMITIGTTLEDSKAAIALASELEGVAATVGIHPHEAKDGLDGIEALLREPNVVAVGECGLDYHYDHSPRAVQRDVFARQIALARTHDLALVIHTRNAWDDTFALLEDNGVPSRTVFHCFSGGEHEARRALDLGAYLSFSGIVTFPKADDVRAAAALCPADRLLVETDSPYLTPVPHRGTPNRPAFVTLVGEAIGNLKGASAEEMAALTWANADRAYRLAELRPED
ncbi:MAG TPA: TatD family hydrolase [Acidimicrobiales bacterium]|nr:TatD family hydrolase [Acidimicrobiales bacterium]